MHRQQGMFPYQVLVSNSLRWLGSLCFLGFFIFSAQASAVQSSGATVLGYIVFKGAVPAPQRVVVNRDQQVCGRSTVIQNVHVHPETRGVRDAVVNVAVREKTPRTGASPSTAARSSIRNKKCAFFPRIAAGRTGTRVEISNLDPVMHNTNMKVGRRSLLNIALVPNGRTIKKRMRRTGVYNVQCNVHKWMRAYRVFFDHPFFTVSDYYGVYRLHGVPAGRQTISVWHESLGELSQVVQVPAKGHVRIDFEFIPFEY